MTCTTCGINKEVHNAIFGQTFIGGKCVPCAGETVVFAKGAVNKVIQDAAIAASQTAQANARRGNTKRFEWSPEIAEAMRLR